MFTILGMLVVIGCVIGGFVFIDGPMHVLFQPGELIIIGGAGLGSLFCRVRTPSGRASASKLRMLCRRKDASWYVSRY
jgi:flagellar motor component MotA